MNKRIFSIVSIVLIVAILSLCLVACNADTYKDKLEEKGYIVDDCGKYQYATIGVDQDDVKWGVKAIKGSGTSINYVYVIKFKSIKKAKAYIDKLEEMTIEYNVDRVSSFVFYGTKQGLEDAE